MSALFNALVQQPTAFTHNGMATLATSGNDLLDLFGIIGNRNFSFEDNLAKIKMLFETDPVSLGRLFLWSRDCRGGAGHRDPIRKLILLTENKNVKFSLALAARLPELGYYKDLIYLYSKSNKPDLKQGIMDLFIIELSNALKEKRFSLLAKYLPRKGDLAVQFRNELKLSPKTYRKVLVQLSKTVEQQMCAKDWENINFEHVPSIAMMRYRKAFERHGANFQKFQEDVAAGKVKLNSSQLTPGEIVNKAFNTSSRDETQQLYFTNAWNSLPDYLEGSDERWLPVIDVSGSMTCSAGKNTSLCCLDVAIGLGLYLTERNNGIFKNQFITFSSDPSIVDLKNKKFATLKDKLSYIKNADWGTSTDIEKVFNLVLKTAVANNLPESDMPTKVVIFSDMEMNQCTNVNERLLQMIENKYKVVGYKMPQLVFWNLHARGGNMTVNLNDNGACQVSGYTTSIMKNLTRLEQYTPLSVMMETIGSERYNF